MANLNVEGALIDGKFYRVIDYPEDLVESEGPRVLRKGIAYRIDTDITHGLFPYRGEVKVFNQHQLKVGLYMLKTANGYVRRIVRPRTKQEKAMYGVDNAKNIAVAFVNHEYTPDQFMDIDMNSSAGGKTFKPPIHASDDMLNTAVKVAIRLKDAPFEPYGKRLEALAVDRSSIEGVNIKNNTKRAMINNRTMSPSKALTYGDTWQLEYAIVVRDAPGAIHPMFTDGTILVMYPSGPAFELNPDKIVNMEDYINQAIRESTADAERERREKEERRSRGETVEDNTEEDTL